MVCCNNMRYTPQSGALPESDDLDSISHLPRTGDLQATAIWNRLFSLPLHSTYRPHTNIKIS
jgi:hypothetical protein